ncbi:MAG TPA: hypothetical protein VGE14_03015 [Marmoricola sp.]
MVNRGRATSAPGTVAVLLQELTTTGEYAVTIRPTSHQELVDLRWAALHAGEHLGRRVRVLVTRKDETMDAPLDVRLTCALDRSVGPAERPAVPTQRLPEP